MTILVSIVVLLDIARFIKTFETFVECVRGNIVLWRWRRDQELQSVASYSCSRPSECSQTSQFRHFY